MDDTVESFYFGSTIESESESVLEESREVRCSLLRCRRDGTSRGAVRDSYRRMRDE